MSSAAALSTRIRSDDAEKFRRSPLVEGAERVAIALRGGRDQVGDLAIVEFQRQTSPGDARWRAGEKLSAASVSKTRACRKSPAHAPVQLDRHGDRLVQRVLVAVVRRAALEHSHHEHGGCVEGHQRQVPDARGVDDAPPGAGDERLCAGDVGRLALRLRRDDDKPARGIDRPEQLCAQGVALEQPHLHRGRRWLEVVERDDVASRPAMVVEIAGEIAARAATLVHGADVAFGRAQHDRRNGSKRRLVQRPRPQQDGGGDGRHRALNLTVFSS